jgi:hypothetical protein
MASKRKPLGWLNATWTVTTPEEHPVYLIGSTRELGEWNTDMALPLHNDRPIVLGKASLESSAMARQRKKAENELESRHWPGKKA